MAVNSLNETPLAGEGGISGSSNSSSASQASIRTTDSIDHLLGTHGDVKSQVSRLFYFARGSTNALLYHLRQLDKEGQGKMKNLFRSAIKESEGVSKSELRFLFLKLVELSNTPGIESTISYILSPASGEGSQDEILIIQLVEAILSKKDISNVKKGLSDAGYTLTDISVAGIGKIMSRFFEATEVGKMTAEDIKSALTSDPTNVVYLNLWRK